MTWFRVLLFSLCACLIGLSHTPAQAQNFRDVSRVVDAAVGRVLVVVRDRYAGHGSGFILGPSSTQGGYYFVTNNHVIDGAEQLFVGFLVEGEVVLYGARVMDRSSGRDLALLELFAPEGRRISVQRGLPVATNEIEKGEDVAAIGFPGFANDAFGEVLDANSFVSTLTTGIVSRVVAGEFPGQRTQLDIIQHTAEINQGNSGGPLIDLCGTVVGVNTAGALGVREDGLVPQGIYLSSAGPEIARFLRETGVPFTTRAQPCDGTAPATPVDSGSGASSAGLDEGGRRLAILGALLATVTLFGGLGFVYARGGFGGGIAARGATSGELSIGGQSGGPTVLKAELAGKSMGLTTAALRRGITIGRGSNTEMTISNAALSRAHAKLALDGRRLMLTDLGSSNGTRLDGQALAPNVPTQINTQSRIELADLALRLSRP